MSKSSEIKGRKNAKKNNLRSNKGYRKHISYGAVKTRAYDGEEDLVGIVNKKKERRKNKINPLNISESFEELENDGNILYGYPL